MCEILDSFSLATYTVAINCSILDFLSLSFSIRHKFYGHFAAFADYGI